MLKRGYSKQTIEKNIDRELRTKKPMRQVLVIVYERARDSYREKHPRGPFPKHLQR